MAVQGKAGLDQIRCSHDERMVCFAKKNVRPEREMISKAHYVVQGRLSQLEVD